MAHHFMEEAGSNLFSHSVIRTVVDELFHRVVEGLDTSPSSLMDGLTDKRAQELVASVAMIPLDKLNPSKLIDDRLKRFKLHKITSELVKIRSLITQEKDIKKKAELLERQKYLNEISKQLNNPQNKRNTKKP